MQTQTRTFNVEVRAVGDSLEASFASETPYQRSWGIEILECTPRAVDLVRAADGLPMLGNHDTKTLIGRARDLRVVDRKLRGRVQFFDTPPGRDARTAVDSGHREVSIAYEILESREEDGGVVRVTKWRPYEVSLVSIPADPTVGINRSHHSRNIQMENDTQEVQASAQADSAMSRSQRRAASQGDQQYRENAAEIVELARKYSHLLQPGQAERALQGGNVAALRDQIMSAMSTSHTDSRGADAGRAGGMDAQQREWDRLASGFSLSRAVLAQVDPAAYMRGASREAEVAQELTRRSGIQTTGMVVPIEALFAPLMRGVGHNRDFTVAVASEGGSTVQNTIRADLWTDVLRSRSAAISLGAVVMTGLTGNQVIPKKATSTAPGWVTETGVAPESTATFGSSTLSPKRIGAFAEVTRQLLTQSSLAMENLLQRDLSESILSELDRVILVGSGTGNEPQGIANASGIGAVAGGTNGAQLTWAHVLDLEKAVAQANGLTNLLASGYAINPSTRGWAKRTLKVPGVGSNLIMGDTPVDPAGLSALNAYRAAVSTHLPSTGVKGTSGAVCSTLIFGDFSQVIVGMFGGGVELTVDPYTLATTGMVRITANLFADVAVRRPASFAVMKDALTA